MGPFEDVTFEWEGKSHTIPAHRMMGAINRIENAVTLQELVGYAERGIAPLGKVAMGYAAVLRYVGVTVTDTEVYEKMFSSKEAQAFVLDASMGLLEMMVPPSARGQFQPKVPNPGNLPKAAAPMSRRRTRRRWVRAG